MKKNEMKHLSTVYLDRKYDKAVIILESIKNSTMGCPRYEAVVFIESMGSYKVRVEGYKGTRDLAFDAYQKVINTLSEMTE